MKNCSEYEKTKKNIESSNNSTRKNSCGKDRVECRKCDKCKLNSVENIE